MVLCLFKLLYIRISRLLLYLVVNETMYAV